jgi:predicted nucleic acid-binding protein
MAFLLDTNCWMQLVRRREHAEVVGELLRVVPRDNIHITDYALHSLMPVMHRNKQLEEFPEFVRIARFEEDSAIINIPALQLTRVIDCVRLYKLDVDDSYQYVAAESNGLHLVSLDTDFDRTPRGRLTPAAALQLFMDEQKQSKDA